MEAQLAQLKEEMERNSSENATQQQKQAYNALGEATA